MFDCYQHYCKIFQPNSKRNVMAGVRSMAMFCIIVATEFSFRQLTAVNPEPAANLLKGGVGYMIANVDLAFAVLLFSAGLAASYALYKVDTFG